MEAFFPGPVYVVYLFLLSHINLLEAQSLEI